MKPDRNAVPGDRRNITQGAELRLLACAHPGLLGEGRFDIRGRPQVDFAGVAIDDDRITLLDDLRDVGNIADCRHG